MNEEKVAQGLGWFSIVLGSAEVLAPQELADWLGLNEQAGIVRAFGFREIAAGIGILAGKTRLAPWLWARVAGDALDSGVLGSALSPDNKNRNNAMIAIAAVSPIIALDVWCAYRLLQQEER